MAGALLVIGGCQSHSQESNGTSSSSSGTPEGVHCSSDGDSCACVAMGDANDTACTSETVNAPTGSQGYCCADETWPATGGCACEVYTPPTNDVCVITTSTTSNEYDCECHGWGNPSGLNVVSQCLPKGGTCCINQKTPRCDCFNFPNQANSCAATNQTNPGYYDGEVASCKTALFHPICPSNRQLVDSCNAGSSTGVTTGGGQMGWADPGTCKTGSENFYECCALGGGSCTDLSQDLACCENKSCASGKILACMATHAATDVDTCLAAVQACGG